MSGVLRERVEGAYRRVIGVLRSEMGPAGHWTGELSSSALSTATAVTALAVVDRRAHAPLLAKGLGWLAAHSNADGGWGDTVRSRSNPSTTALVWAAFGAAEADADHPEVVGRAVAYLERTLGPRTEFVSAIEALYGKDRTFSVPITMTLALSGRLGTDGWSRVRSLPFELAVLPRGLFGALQLPVVSYALPALIAIGQVIHARSGRFHPLRSWARDRTLEVLTTLQPENGGFLEATPLTSFVTMSLAGMGWSDHLVARRGAEFLRRSVRADGSWPIDTNLATWVTTLAIHALRAAPEGLDSARRARLRQWLFGQQGKGVHPYTGAAPGGWAWTDLPGGVPDADDTSGALLALHHLEGDREPSPEVIGTVSAGVRWLLDLQNRDGGVPTFCRGWGTLPFDRSTPEITAHVLRAWAVWRPRLNGKLVSRVEQATRKALRYLAGHQRPDGAWIPLWFGNEAAAGQLNPVYGTAKVLAALEGLTRAGHPVDEGMRRRGAGFLVRAQGADGSWGGDAGITPSIEETAVATEALSGFPDLRVRVEEGLAALVSRLETGPEPEAAPVGLYFARLWYFERLYPWVMAGSALARALESEGG